MINDSLTCGVSKSFDENSAAMGGLASEYSFAKVVGFNRVTKRL